MKASVFALILCCATGIVLAQTPPDRPPGPPNARQQLHAETVQQLTPVLTQSQLKKFEVLMEEERGPRGRGPHGPPRSDTPPPASN